MTCVFFIYKNKKIWGETMDYEKIENLVVRAKSFDKEATLDLITEFTPLMKSLSRKTHISNYAYEDINQECVISLLKCIKKYNLETHRFVAYATNGIKNNLNYLIRKNLVHREITSQDSLTPTGSLEDLNIGVAEEIDLNLIDEHNKKLIKKAVVNCLNDEQKELFIYIRLKKNTVKEYAKLKNISYTTAAKRKNIVLKILSEFMKYENEK